MRHLFAFFMGTRIKYFKFIVIGLLMPVISTGGCSSSRGDSLNGSQVATTNAALYFGVPLGCAIIFVTGRAIYLDIKESEPAPREYPPNTFRLSDAELRDLSNNLSGLQGGMPEEEYLGILGLEKYRDQLTIKGSGDLNSQRMSIDLGGGKALVYFRNSLDNNRLIMPPTPWVQ